MGNQINIGDQNTQQIRQNPAIQPIQISDKPKANYWMILTIIFTVLFLGTVVCLISSQKSKRESTVPIPTPQVAVPTSLPPVIPTELPAEAGLKWKTYKNEKYNYTVNFPSYWGINPHQENMTGVLPSMQDDVDFFNPRAAEEGIVSMGIGVNAFYRTQDRTCKTLNECLVYFSERSDLLTEKDIEISGEKAKSRLYQDKHSSISGVSRENRQKYLYVIFLNKDNLYIISFIVKSSLFDKQQDKIDQILASFSFFD